MLSIDYIFLIVFDNNMVELIVVFVFINECIFWGGRKIINIFELGLRF